MPIHDDVPEEYVIRPATLQDSSELARLRWEFSPGETAGTGQTFEGFREDFKRFLREAFTLGAFKVWAVEREGRLIANVYVHRVIRVPRPGQDEDRWGYVTNVYVEPDARGRGVGSALLQTVIAWAREQEYELLLVWPSEEGVTFYERAGFVPSADALELLL